MQGLLAGEVAVVTGAAQGIGLGIARGLAEAGASVGLVDIHAQALEEARQTLEAEGRSVSAAPANIADPAACEHAIASINDAFGAPSVLVNNAGVIRRGSIADSDAVEALEGTMAVNLGGAVNMIRACLPHLTSRQGRIVNIASIQAFISLPNSFAYTASKGAVLQLTRALAQELAPSGIRVNAIAPGGIATPLNAPTRARPGYVEEFLKRVPLKRFGEPSDLAGPVVFLSSAMSAYVTGVCLPVDGGFLAV